MLTFRPGDTVVAICDWRGRVTWTSGADAELAKAGDFAWEQLKEPYQEVAKQTIARVIALSENATLEVQIKSDERFRIWLWPLDCPATAICALATGIPTELGLLTSKEREILGLLAVGHAVRNISGILNVSTSTVHTHLRKARQKLSLPNVESLTGFAARYCYPDSFTGTEATQTEKRPSLEHDS